MNKLNRRSMTPLYERVVQHLPLVLLMALLVSCSDDPASTGLGDLGTDASDMVGGDATGGDATVGDASLPPVPCEPGDNICYEGYLATCLANGAGWLLEACEEDETCSEGACVANICEAGERLCAPGRVLICRDDGQSWDIEPCEDGWACYEGDCIQCIAATECLDGQTCEDGLCVALPLTLLTEELPDGIIGTPYEFLLEADGGLLPYAWGITEGALPSGMSLSLTGQLSGTPTESGEFDFAVQVTDEEESEAEATYTLVIHPEGLIISTDSLPVAEEGIDYSAQLEALGGALPYAWMAASGTFPAGIVLQADGRIVGIPTEIGEFPITFRVFDSGLPPAYAERELILTVDIAPLEIFGDQEIPLLITKIITLQLITVIEGIPIPYSTQLQARGGLRPYHWTETEIPAAVSFLISDSGIPDGLTLDEDGTLHGAVTSDEQVISIAIPFTEIALSGFFFMAEVADSQSPPETRSALFLIPTIPLGG